MSSLLTLGFVEQPLALPKSAYYVHCGLYIPSAHFDRFGPFVNR